MGMKRNLSIAALAGVAVVAVAGYLFGMQQQQADARPELLIYCGITMKEPMARIARELEQSDGFHSVIISGGSGNLLRAIETNQVGDLYLPGSDAYIADAKGKGLVTDTVHVGYNKAAIMVRKGNPKGIRADLAELARADLYVVIGNPESGSIGRETRKILTKAGLYEQVAANAREMTTDSKRLSQVLREGVADVVINWYATSTWSDNRKYIDTLPIDERFAKKKRLVLGLLTTSHHPDLARRFMDYAASARGRELFNQGGLYEVQ
jgi:molybdate transport system substrate-binding protein